ncbi:MAG: PQQ-dependent sugar dehydrogenase [Patescibacteria group bacterium]
MQKRLLILIVIVGFIGLGIFYYIRHFRGIWPAVLPPPGDIADLLESEKPVTSSSDGVFIGQRPASSTLETTPTVGPSNATGFPLKIPAGFSIEIFAKNVPGARVMALDKFGNMWVSQTKEGLVSVLEITDGKVKNQRVVFRHLRNPHGIVFDSSNYLDLYIAEEHQITRGPVGADGSRVKIADLPSGGNHVTRTLSFGPDGRLYVSIGSSCDVCHEQDPLRAAIYSLNKDGSDFHLFARGLRNSVFFTWHPVTGQMWATDMGRDYLGDNLPPDEINIISEGKNYGWPECYGKNILDETQHLQIRHQHVRAHCTKPFEEPSHIDIPAHSAPLGLAFVPADPPSLKASEGRRGWPEDYWYDLFVAYHGSWNRSAPTGYKVVRFQLDNHGTYQAVEDFITGWLTKEGALGRPAGFLIQPGGILYISDDHAGVIYKVRWRGQ